MSDDITDDTSAEYLIDKAKGSVWFSEDLRSQPGRDAEADEAEHEDHLAYGTAAAAVATAMTAREILAELKEANVHLRALRGLP